MQYDFCVTMEMHKLIVMQQYHHVTIATHFYTTGTITSLWKCNITHCYTIGTVTLLWKCHQGLIYHNIFQLKYLYILSYFYYNKRIITKHKLCYSFYHKTIMKLKQNSAVYLKQLTRLTEALSGD
jgi:hypothetical protein